MNGNLYFRIRIAQLVGLIAITATALIMCINLIFRINDMNDFMHAVNEGKEIHWVVDGIEVGYEEVKDITLSDKYSFSENDCTVHLYTK